MEVAEEICDQLAIVNHGRIIARGNLSELRMESGEAEGSLEEVFLRLTAETEDERAEKVATRFAGGSAPDDEDQGAA